MLEKILNFVAKNLFRSDFLVTEQISQEIQIPANAEIGVELTPPQKDNYKCIGVASWNTWHHAINVGQVQRLDNGKYKVILKSTSNGIVNSAIFLDLLYFRIGGGSN